MTASNQGGGRSGGVPVRSIGRSFASMDPERVREVVADDQARVGAKEHAPAPAPEAGREHGESAGNDRQPHSHQGANQLGGQGGSGKRR